MRSIVSVPVLIGILGLGMVIWGIVIATGAKSATPLLGAGVALIAIGVAFRGADEARVDLTWGDATISVVRGVRSALERSGAGAPQQVREKIDPIVSSLHAVEERLSSQLDASIARRSPGVPLPPLPWGDATPAHERAGEEMRLTLVYGDSIALGVFCTVTDENGYGATARVDPVLDLGEVRAFSITYPGDFVGALALYTGHYEVSWSKVRSNERRGEEIAIDEFDWT